MESARGRRSVPVLYRKFRKSLSVKVKIEQRHEGRGQAAMWVSRGREVRLGRRNSRAGQRVSLALWTEEETKSLVKSSNVTE